MDETTAILYRYALGIWERRWIALGTAWVICLVGWLGVMSLPSIYEADTEVAVPPQSALAPFLHGLTVGTNTETRAALLLQKTLLSRPVLATLIKKENLLDGRDTPEARGALEGKLSKAVHIVPEISSFQSAQIGNLFTIAYRNRDAERAYAVVKGLLGIFVDRTAGANRTDLTNAQHFLDGQIAWYSRQLHEVARRRAAFKDRYAELLPGDKGTPSKFERARADVEALEARLQVTKAQIALLHHELATTPETLAAGPNPANAQALAAAEEHLAALRQQFTDAYPGVIQARKVVAALESGKGLTALPGQTIPNPVYDRLRVQLIDAQTSELTAQRQLEAAIAERDRVAALANSKPNLLADYSNLDRTYQMARTQYEELLSRRASMQITAAAAANAYPLRLNIINPPELPTVPVAPRRKLFLAGVLMVGLGGGAMLAFVLAYADNCCYTVRELEAIGWPVIGGVSLRQTPERHRRSLRLLGFGAGLVLLFVAGAGLIVIGGHTGWHA